MINKNNAIVSKVSGDCKPRLFLHVQAVSTPVRSAAVWASLVCQHQLSVEEERVAKSDEEETEAEAETAGEPFKSALFFRVSPEL